MNFNTFSCRGDFGSFVIWVEKSPIIMQCPCWLKLPSPHCCQCLQKTAKQHSKDVAADVWTAN